MHYGVRGISNEWLTLRKFTSSQFRCATYNVLVSECYPVLPNILSCDQEIISRESESDDEYTTPSSTFNNSHSSPSVVLPLPEAHNTSFLNSNSSYESPDGNDSLPVVQEPVTLENNPIPASSTQNSECVTLRRSVRPNIGINNKFASETWDTNDDSD